MKLLLIILKTVIPVTSEIDRGREQEIVASRNPADYCVTYNTQYKENYYTGRYKVCQQLNISGMVSRKSLKFGKGLRAFKFYSFQFFQFYTFICFRDTRLT
jgi:hypothetical protein